jgi:plastocyanin
MRKHYTLGLLALLIFVSAKATIITVEVTNNQFNPASITNVTVGDVIRYHFVLGFHNAVSATVANSLPAGADPINSGDASGNNPRDYDYTVTAIGDYKYVCEVHGDKTAFTGMVGSFTASAALPTTLKAFNLATAANKKPLFKWSTVTEENVSHFSLRSSYDGFKYNEVGKVKAVGNSTTEQAYSFTDNSVPDKYKYVYYILAMIDKDGTEKLSKVLVFKNPLGIGKLITQIGPNPIKRPGQLMIQFNSEKSGNILTRVFDESGKMVLETKMTAYPGLNNGHVHVCDLNPGIYTLQFSLDGIKENKRIIVH